MTASRSSDRSGSPGGTFHASSTPFVTTNHHGLGVGLTITRSIVDAHGGIIAAQGYDDGEANCTARLPPSGGHPSPPLNRRELEK